MSHTVIPSLLPSRIRPHYPHVRQTDGRVKTRALADQQSKTRAHKYLHTTKIVTTAGRRQAPREGNCAVHTHTDRHKDTHKTRQNTDDVGQSKTGGRVIKSAKVGQPATRLTSPVRTAQTRAYLNSPVRPSVCLSVCLSVWVACLGPAIHSIHRHVRCMHHLCITSWIHSGRLDRHGMDRQPAR